jgi:hypothetical protein
MLSFIDPIQKWLEPILDPLAMFQESFHCDEVLTLPEPFLKQLRLRLQQKLKHAPIGEDKSLLKGPGLDFTQLRPYMPGDDIRKIDWNVFARTFTPYIKEYQEEKQVTVWLVIDFTPSMFFGQQKTKAQWAMELAGLIGLLAQQSGHRLGLFLFTGSEKICISPNPSYNHLQRLMKVLLTTYQKVKHQVFSSKQDLFEQSFLELGRILPKRSVIFLISDFLSLKSGWEKILGELSRTQSQVTYFWLWDGVEKTLGEAQGLIHLFDPESGNTRWVEMGEPSFQTLYRSAVEAEQKRLWQVLSKSGKPYAFEISKDPIEGVLCFLRGHEAQGALA